MGSLTAEHVNEQAPMVASQVLNDSVIAAARCEQVTQGFGQRAAADSTAQLAQLAQLHAAGALTDEEFAAQKANIIGGR